MPHYRAILETLGIKALIATYAHYVPYDIEDGLFCYDSSLNNANLGISIVSCFLSGLQLSDIVFTHSKLSLSLLMALYKKNNLEFEKEKFIINPPPMDPFLQSNNPIPQKKCFYNHRLYKHYCIVKEINLMDKILAIQRQKLKNILLRSLQLYTLRELIAVPFTTTQSNNQM